LHEFKRCVIAPALERQEVARDYVDDPLGSSGVGGLGLGISGPSYPIVTNWPYGALKLS